MSTVADAPHPGTFIKAEVIPPGMSVTKAAQLMGVGRPALSNLLNGNAALSAEIPRNRQVTAERTSPARPFRSEKCR